MAMHNVGFMKIAKVIPAFRWDGKCTWWIEGALAKRVHQWEEEDQQTCKEEEHRKMGQHRWQPVNGC